MSNEDVTIGNHYKYQDRVVVIEGRRRIGTELSGWYAKHVGGSYIFTVYSSELKEI